MAPITGLREITRPEDMRQLKAGQISILTGKNLKTTSEASSTKPSAPQSDGAQQEADNKCLPRTRGDSPGSV